VLDIVWVGLLLILAGVVVMVVGILSSSASGERQVKGGAVILIGPIPIAFGSDARWTSIAIALAIVLIVVTLLLYVI
jgi:uncharacterized protein (TIGR00304 family)